MAIAFGILFVFFNGRVFSTEYDLTPTSEARLHWLYLSGRFHTIGNKRQQAARAALLKHSTGLSGRVTHALRCCIHTSRLFAELRAGARGRWYVATSCGHLPIERRRTGRQPFFPSRLAFS